MYGVYVHKSRYLSINSFCMNSFSNVIFLLHVSRRVQKQLMIS